MLIELNKNRTQECCSVEPYYHTVDSKEQQHFAVTLFLCSPLHQSHRCIEGDQLSYPVFIPKPSTHRMHDPGSIVPHIRPKVFTDNQMSRIKYIYYINSVSKH
jgi:hypothetical protein